MSDKPTTGKELMHLLKKVRGDDFSPWDSLYEADVQPFFSDLQPFEYQRYVEEVFAVRCEEFEKLCEPISAETGGAFDTFGPFDNTQYRDYYIALTDDQKTHFDTFLNECRARTLSVDFGIRMDHYTYQKHKYNAAKYAARKRFKLLYSLYRNSGRLQTSTLGYGSWTDHQIEELGVEVLQLYEYLIKDGSIDKIPELEEPEQAAVIAVIEAPYLVWTKAKTDLGRLFFRLKDEGYVAAQNIAEFIAHHIRLLNDDGTPERLTKKDIGNVLRQFSRDQPTAKGSPEINAFLDSYFNNSQRNEGEDDAA